MVIYQVTGERYGWEDDIAEGEVLTAEFNGEMVEVIKRNGQYYMGFPMAPPQVSYAMGPKNERDGNEL